MSIVGFDNITVNFNYSLATGDYLAGIISNANLTITNIKVVGSIAGVSSATNNANITLTNLTINHNATIINDL